MLVMDFLFYSKTTKNSNRKEQARPLPAAYEGSAKLAENRSTRKRALTLTPCYCFEARKKFAAQT